jgi:peptide-methionine (R)-S-oxide reductase
VTAKRCLSEILNMTFGRILDIIIKKMKFSLRLFTSALFIVAALTACDSQSGMRKNSGSDNPYYSRTDTTHLDVSDAEWKRILPDSIYTIAREKGTEYAFTGKFWNYEGLGTYYCAVCGNALFVSDSKFASMCGWPSFYETIRPQSVLYVDDYTHGMQRIEVLCGRCDSHLGHVFDDGPPPTGKRFCMNSIVLDFEPRG